MELSDERKAFSHKAIYIGFGATLLVGFAAGLFIFFSFTTYEPQALRRIPENAPFVARLNVQQAVVHQPLVRSLLPLLERGREGPESRLLHLERRTTLELDVDVRELVFAELGSGRWLLVAGGFLRSDEVIGGIGRMLEDEGAPHGLSNGMIVLDGGASLCVAENGALVLARDTPDAERACGVPGPLPSWAGALSRPGLALGVRATRPPTTSPHGKNEPQLVGGTFVVDADSHFPFAAKLELMGADGTADQVNRVLEENSSNFQYLFPLGALQSRPEEGAEFRGQGNLSREQFDQSVARLATRIGRAVWSEGPDRPAGPESAR